MTKDCYCQLLQDASLPLMSESVSFFSKPLL